jgi:hypothetical protein
MRETLRKMEAIMQNASLGMVFTRDRRITRYNPKFAQMYGHVGHVAVDLAETMPQPPPARHSPAADAGGAPMPPPVALAGKLPLYFVENRGQEAAEVAYYVQGRDTAVYFTGTGVTIALTNASATRSAIDRSSERAPISPVALAPESAAPQRWAVRLDFVGATPSRRAARIPRPRW